MGLYSAGLIIGRIFSSDMAGKTYFREGSFLGGWGGGGGLIIGILRYAVTVVIIRHLGCG